MTHYQAIVLGTGAVGSAALLALARRGVRALGLDRFPPGHDRGSSHGTTRIIRQAYFEHPHYVPLVLRAYELWRELEQRRGETLLTQTGLLQVGPADGTVLAGVRRSAQEHQLPLEELSAAEVEKRWSGFRVPRGMSGVYEERAGYLRVEACVVAQAEEAVRLGAELCVGETILGWTRGDAATPGNGPLVVRTNRKTYSAERLIVCAGAWAGELLGDLRISLEVRRKPQYWFATGSDEYRVERGFPAFLYELPSGVFYGFPQIDERGVKVARHSGGEVVRDPLNVDRDLDPADRKLVEEFCVSNLPRLTRTLAHHSMCMYTMTPDEHFVVDRHPRDPRVAFAAGLSGHGFKFAPVLGEALADLALHGRTNLPVGFLGMKRLTRATNGA
ncbi:MAG: N-methyl-L-tryptophan oxidase [Planctomycetia bacterium]|nr:N-methyl-L-tryptophan oxidase [Planctomycetia bacterium]